MVKPKPKSEPKLPKPTQVSILGYDDEPDDVDRTESDRRLARGMVSVEKLEEEVKAFLGAMEAIIGGLPYTVGKYEMDSLTVSAEVNATGKVSLFGTGGEVGGKGGLSFTFKRIE